MKFPIVTCITCNQATKTEVYAGLPFEMCAQQGMLSKRAHPYHHIK